MEQQACHHCGQLVAAYYLSGGLCDGCKWDTWIPRGYGRREQYVVNPEWGHPNATRRPALGVDFLDRHRTVVAQVLAMCRTAPRSGAWQRRADDDNG